MLRKIYIILLGLSLTLSARADDPKPPWQRLLTGDDAKKAAEVKKRIAQLEWADKYPEAVRLQEELLALRTKVQGADHWEAVDEKWKLMTLKKIAALPEEKRTGWRKARRGAVEADQLEQKAQYPAALPLRQGFLRWSRQVLGEDHPDTAMSYNNLALNLNAQARYAEAEPLSQKALDISRKVLGEKHPYTAVSYDNVGFNLNSLGKYVEAGPIFQNALDIFLKVLGEDDPDTVTLL